MCLALLSSANNPEKCHVCHQISDPRISLETSLHKACELSSVHLSSMTISVEDGVHLQVAENAHRHPEKLLIRQITP